MANRGPFTGTPSMGTWSTSNPTNILGTTVPQGWYGPGENAYEGKRPGRGPISETDFSFNNDVTEHITEMSNYRITYPRVLRETYRTSGDGSAIVLHQVFFVKKQYAMTNSGFNKRRPGDRYSGANLASMNYALFRRDKSGWKRFIETGEKDSLLTIEKILKDYYIEGVVASEEGGEKPSEFPAEFGKERIVNSTVRGRATVFNTWGKKVKQGTHLYFILKRVDVTDPYVVHPTAAMKLDSPAILYGKPNPKDYKNNPFQFIPYANCNPKKSYPSLKDRLYFEFNDQGEKLIKYGAVIYFGRVEENIDDLNMTPSHPLKLFNNVSAIVSQPKMMVHVDILPPQL